MSTYWCHSARRIGRSMMRSWLVVSAHRDKIDDDTAVWWKTKKKEREILHYTSSPLLSVSLFLREWCRSMCCMCVTVVSANRCVGAGWTQITREESRLSNPRWFSFLLLSLLLPSLHERVIQSRGRADYTSRCASRIGQIFWQARFMVSPHVHDNIVFSRVFFHPRKIYSRTLSEDWFHGRFCGITSSFFFFFFFFYRSHW